MYIIHGQLRSSDDVVIREAMLFTESEAEAKDRVEHVRDFLEKEMDDDGAAAISVYCPDKINDFLESVTPELRFESEATADDEEH